MLQSGSVGTHRATDSSGINIPCFAGLKPWLHTHIKIRGVGCWSQAGLYKERSHSTLQGGARYPEKCPKNGKKNPAVAAPSFHPHRLMLSAAVWMCWFHVVLIQSCGVGLLSSFNNVIFATFSPWKPRTKLCVSGNKALTQWSVFMGRDDSNQAF